MASDLEDMIGGGMSDMNQWPKMHALNCAMDALIAAGSKEKATFSRDEALHVAAHAVLLALQSSDTPPMIQLLQNPLPR